MNPSAELEKRVTECHDKNDRFLSEMIHPTQVWLACLLNVVACYIPYHTKRGSPFTKGHIKIDLNKSFLGEKCILNDIN